MPGFERVVISFFKQKNIPYYLEKQYLHFSCFFCNTTIRMSVTDAKWECNICMKDGSLFTLIKYVDIVERAKMDVYNPRKEIWLINSGFKKLKRVYRNSELDSLHKRVQRLAQYFLDHI
jgi:ribosomal protein L37AE/L43A